MPTIQSYRNFATLTLSTLLLCASGNAQESSSVAGIELASLASAGYRIDWINQSSGKNIRLPEVTDKSMYIIDDEDNLTRYDVESGQWLWSTPIGNKVFQMRGLIEDQRAGYVYAVSDGAIYVLESATGNYPSSDDAKSVSNNQFHALDWVASTGAILDDGILIYGSTTGDTVWFDPTIGFVSYRYKIGSSMQVTPTIARGVRDIQMNNEYLFTTAIIATANNGSVIAIDANQVRLLWSLKLLGEVNAPITSATNTTTIEDEAVPRTSVFIAGSDQYLRAIDLLSGTPRWEYLTTAQLEDSPFIHGDSLYQRIPNVGLVCFKAFPNDISGEQLWVAENVLGKVITTTKTGWLVCWDKDQHLLQIIEPRGGGVVHELSIPSTKILISDSETNGALYIITKSDMLLRIVPRR